MYYVYRFLDGLGNIIYVGRTKTSISTRMNQHFGKQGHLSIECYNCVHSIEYIELKSQINMYIKELYYIDKWKPTYNDVNKYEEESETILEESEQWIKYKNKTDIRIESLEKALMSQEVEVETLKNEIEEHKEKQIRVLYLEKEVERLSCKISLSERGLEIASSSISSEDTALYNDEKFNLEECKVMLKAFRGLAFYSDVKVGADVAAEYKVYSHQNQIRILIDRKDSLNDCLLEDITNVKSLNYFEDASWLEAISRLSEFMLLNSEEHIKAIEYIKEYRIKKKEKEERLIEKRNRLKKAEQRLTNTEYEEYIELYQSLNRDDQDDCIEYFCTFFENESNILEAYKSYIGIKNISLRAS